MILEEVERTQDIHRLSDSCSLTGLLVRKSHGLRQTQRFLSQGIHAAQSDRLFSSLQKRDVLQKAHLLSCRETEASDWLRAIPNPKYKSAVSGASWNTMMSLRLLIPMETICSCCFEAGSAAAPEKYGHHALVCRHKYGYTRRHNTIKDTLAQLLSVDSE